MMNDKPIIKAERARVCKQIEDTLLDMSEKKRGYVSMPVTKWQDWQDIKDGAEIDG